MKDHSATVTPSAATLRAKPCDTAFDSLRGKMVVKRIGIVTAEPQGDAMSERRDGAQIDQGAADCEGDRLRVKDHCTGGREGPRLQADGVGIKVAGCIEICDLNADEVGADEMRHESCPELEGMRYVRRLTQYKATDISSSTRRGEIADQAFAPHDTVGYALKRAQHAMRLHMDRHLRHLGLNASTYSVLCSIAEEPGASNARLARRAFVTPQTMQAMLVKLAEVELIERTPDDGHGRIQRTLLTPKGQSVLSEAHVAARTSEQLARDAAGADTIAVLIRIAEALS
jgi:DNA-binding MarR family transcriptional regulator